MAEVKTDSLKAAYDDDVEDYVCPTPNVVNRVDYQFLCNSLGKGGYNFHLLGSGKEEPSWQGGYQQAHTQKDGWWNTEIAIPLASLGAGAQGRQATDGLWAINLCRDWKPDRSWSSLRNFEFPVDKFRDGRQETMVELPNLAGEYEIALKAEGVNCSQGETVKTFERAVSPSRSQRQGNGDKRMKVVPVLFLCPHSLVHYPAPAARGCPMPSSPWVFGPEYSLMARRFHPKSGAWNRERREPRETRTG